MRPHTNVIMVAALACAACSPSRRRTPDGTLVVVMQNAATTIDPRFAVSNYDSTLSKLVASGLTTVDTPTAEPRLDLAAAIDWIDPRTVDITLRDAAFSDGTPVTANDVVRTYQSVLDPKCKSLHRKAFAERFVSIEVLEDSGAHRLRLHLAQTLGTLLSDLDFGIVSFRGVAPGQCSAPSVIGAGPYRLQTLTAYRAELDANPHYGVPAKVPRLEILFVADTAARILMLVGGSADLIANSVRSDLVSEVAERPRVRVNTAPSLLLTYMLLNNDDPVLRDRRVRQAIAVALDRPAAIAARFEGRAVLATGLLPPSHWAYNGDVPRWSRDLPRARALLDEAGYKPGPDGVRLRLVYKTSSDLFRVAVARVLASQLAEVGIAVEVRPFEFATFFADIKRGNYQIATMQTTPITEPDLYYTYFHSSRIPTPAEPDAQNRWHYHNADIDRLTADGRREVDRARRKKLYGEVQRLVASDLPIIPLWHEDNVVLSNADVAGYTIVPNGRFAGLAEVTKR